MSLRWIVDGNNVVGSRPDGWWHDRTGAQLRLVDEVVRWRDAVGEPVVIVIDGYPSDRLPEGLRDGVEVRYSHARQRDAADDEIVRIVDGHDEPETLRVVTSDRVLRERVAAFGAQTEGGGRFLSRIATTEPPHRGD